MKINALGNFVPKVLPFMTESGYDSKSYSVVYSAFKSWNDFLKSSFVVDIVKFLLKLNNQ